MTAHNSRNASNSRNKSNNRTANTISTSANAGILAKVVKPATACREGNYSRDILKTKEMTKGTSWMSSVTAGTGSRKVSNSRKDRKFSRDTSNCSRNSQLEH